MKKSDASGVRLSIMSAKLGGSLAWLRTVVKRLYVLLSDLAGGAST